MRFVIILLFSSLLLNADTPYDFWGSSENTNNKNSVDIREVDTSNVEYLNENDTRQPANIAKDLDKENTTITTDRQKPQERDEYLNTKEDSDVADDLNPKKIKVSPDFKDTIQQEQREKIRQEEILKRRSLPTRNSNVPFKETSKKEPKSESDFLNNRVIFYDENNKRDENFIEIIPYLTIGNSLFKIKSGEYDARVLDDGLSASMSIDLGLNYIWDNRNIGYLWNINFSDYDFNEKDRTHTSAQSSGKISGHILSVMPTVFYELNRAESMSVLLGYGAGISYISLDGNAVLANNNDETISSKIEIEDFYFSHGLILEVLHNNFMISFTKVNITIDESNQDIEINENRLNLGYKFGF